MSLLINSVHLPRVSHTTTAAAMLSPSLNNATSKPPFLSSPFLSIHPLPLSSSFNPPPHKQHLSLSKPISATITPSSNPSQQQQQLYQPFRPPPSPIPPQFRSLDTNGRLEILSNRLGLWFDYAPLIPSLTQQGFTSSTLEEITGISAVEQNRLVVAAQVRDSLVLSKMEHETLAFFDLGGSELLYEIRLLSATQRAAAARYIVDNKLDARGAQDLARAMKDFPRRKGDRGWSNFNYVLPGDCLAFVYYRQALEHQNPELRKLAMEKALETAISEAAKSTILLDMEVKEGEGEGRGGGLLDGVKVPVVRMQVGEVGEATSVVVLPVCRAEEKDREVVDAPWECGTQGDFGIVVAEKGWRRWVVLPGWEPVAGLKKGGVAVAFADARALPWRVNRWYKEEAILVVADRGRKEVARDDGFYLVANNEDGLKVERGSALKERGMKESLGTVLVVVRPPREENDNQLADEDWE